MAFARTVLGDVDVFQLGVTNAHEHLAITCGLITMQHPDYRLNDTNLAIEEIRDFIDAGGSTIVEATPCGVGRDPGALIAISKNTGIHVIGATGVHKDSYYLDSHWRFRYSVEEIARLWQDEVETGMENSGYEGPIVSRSTARAGIVKVGSDYQNISAATRKAFEAAALVHLKTGVPILTHSELGTMMLEQIELLVSLGVSPSHVIISHGDRNPDYFLHRLEQFGQKPL
jgi:5-phospho-D-xylono-1,4-lactonase